MTFDEWCNKMESIGWIWMNDNYNEPADRTMAREAWNAAMEECRIEIQALTNQLRTARETMSHMEMRIPFHWPKGM
jgi:hypothetical protein